MAASNSSASLAACPASSFNRTALPYMPQRTLPGDVVDLFQHAVEFGQRGGRIAGVVRHQGQLEEAVANRGVVRLQAGNLPAELLGPVVFLDFQQVVQEAVPEARFLLGGEGLDVAPASFSISAPA